MPSILLAFAIAQAADPPRAAAEHRRAIACAAREADAAPFEGIRPDAIPGKVLQRCATEVGRAAVAMAAAIAGTDAAIARANVEAKVRREAQTRLVTRLEAGAIREHLSPIEASAARYISCARLAINHRLQGVYLGEDMTDITDPSAERRRAYLTGLTRSSCPRSFADHRRLLAGAGAPTDRERSVEAIEAVALYPHVRLGGRVAAGSRR